MLWGGETRMEIQGSVRIRMTRRCQSDVPGRCAALLFALGLVFFNPGDVLAQPSRGWQVLENCRLVDNPANDGDSFYVRHGREVYIFRLYGVDAPEENMSYPDRLEAQARHFGSRAQDVLRVASEATRFVKRQLLQPFTVETEWRDARGASWQSRYYATIRTAEGKDLGEELAAAGLARVYGYQPPRDARGYSEQRLLRLERQARQSGVGAWAYAARAARATPTPMIQRQTPPEPSRIFAGGIGESPADESAEHPPQQSSSANAPGQNGKIDVNTASSEELQTVPGIGPHYAELIIETRPIRELDDLLAIRGIGPNTLNRWRDQLVVSEESGN